MTKYRHKVLLGNIQIRCREILIQICEVKHIEILKGIVSSDQIHIYIGYSPRLSLHKY